MANVLGLALRITGDATGLRLDPAERALQKLGAEADKVGKVFDQFTATTSAAADAQLATRTKFEQLANSLRAQEITAQDYAEAFVRLKVEAQATAAVFERGARTTAQFATEQEKSAAAIGKLAEELKLGATEAPAFERALSALAGVDLTGTEEGRRQLAAFAQQAREGTLDIDAAARSLQTLAADQTRIEQIFAEGARTTAQFATEQDRAVVSLAKLVDQFSVGAIESKTFEQAISAAFGVDLGASDEIAASVRAIASAVATGNGSVEQYADTLQNLAEQQRAAAEAEQGLRELQSRAAQLVGTLVTEEQRRTAQADEYNRLLQQGLISEEQRAAMLQRLGPITDAARQAEAQLATDRERARQVIESLVTPQERYQQSVADLDRLLGQNLINQEQYNRALAQAQTALDNASGASAAAAEAEARRVALQREGAAITASVQTAEERRAERIAELDRLLGDNAITQETYNRALDQANGLQEAAARAEQERSRVLDEGKRITEQFASVEERRAAELANLERLLAEGAISQETFTRASNQASGANEAAARAERERADALAAASRIIQANITPQERYDAQLVELQGHLEAGRLSQEQFNRAVARASEGLDKTAAAARGADAQLRSIEKTTTLISRIEVARLAIDGFQALGGIARSVASTVQGLLSSFNQQINALDDLAQRTDVGVEALQGYNLAAKLAGVEAEGFATAVTRLGVSIGRANAGDAFDKSLRSLNLTLADLRGLAPEQQFAAIAQQIGALPTSAERAAAAVEVFGKQGAALTPLFRQGVATVEELTRRAERLGVVLREDQVANVTQLNDTFDLVRATVEGIIGQVSGNLAPLVTAISDEFLAFVEAFTGANSSGGTAIADAITDTLLNGAEFLAGVFDSFVAQFGDLSTVLTDAGAVFQATGEVFTIVYEGLRTAFNAFEMAGNSLALALGKALQALGSYLSSDLEAFGDDLVAASQAALDANAQELIDAAARVGEATDRLLTGADGDAAAAGPAEQFIEGMRSRIEQARSPEFRVEANIDAAREAFDEFFNGIVDQSSSVTGLMRDFEAAVAAAQEDATLTADEIARIEDLQKRVNSAIQQELAARSEAVESARKQADEDTKRIDSLLRTSDATTKIIDDLSAVEREIARVQEGIASAAAGDDGVARGRLDELRTLQGQLEEQLQAAAQGFEGGFDKAFAATGENFTRLAEQAAQFGEAGLAAAARLQEGIAAAQEQARDGILNSAAFEAEVARQQRLFEQEIANVRAVADERKRVNELVDQRFLLARFGGDQQRLQAAQNLAALEREIGRVQGEVQAARAAGNQEAVNAGIIRLGQLDQVAAQEQDIASGRRQLEEQIAQQRDQYFQQLQQQQQQAQQQQAAFLAEQRKAIEAEQQRQLERVRELNTLGAGVIGGSDLRTSEGAAQFLQLAANQQDPALIEARLQTRRLTEIRQGILNLVQSFGLPVVQIGAGIG